MEVNRYIISPKAINDIRAISGWHEEQSVDLGESFIIELRSKIRRIMKYPEMYKLVNSKVRRYKMRRFPYLVFYTIEQNTLIIRRVRHAKQKLTQTDR